MTNPENLIELYEGATLVVFILISLIFIKPPAWAKRMLHAAVNLFDRWIINRN
jgi:hypothetical protein